MDVRLPDNTIIKDVPDGTTRAQLAEKLTKNGMTVPPEWMAESAPSARPKPSIMQRIFSTGVPRMGDPLGAGAITDAMSALDEAVTKGAYTAGGKITDVASNLGASPEVAAGLGFATNVGVQSLPMLAGGEVAKGAGGVLKNTARNLMQSALKPSGKALKTGQAAEAITTLLEEGVNVSPGGVAKLRSKIGILNKEIGEAIANSPATVDKQKVAETLLGTLDKFKKQVNPNADLAAINSAWKEFVDHPLLTSDAIPVQLAQEIKQGTYKVLNKKAAYGEVATAATEAQKGLARGLKEGVAQAAPEIAGLNVEESKLLNALSLTEKRALSEANKNPGGLAWLSHNPAAWAAFMADKSALFKSLAARMLNASAEQIPATAARVGIAGATAAQAGPE